MKLNPPLLGLTVPAFTPSATLKIPFEMNPSVLPQLVKGFQCTITNIVNDGKNAKIEFKVYDNIESMIKNGEAIFNLTAEDKKDLKVGIYGHIQLAYIDNADEKGYDSTAAIVKYTATPEIAIETSSNLKSFTGIYETSDLAEGIYQYRFIIRDLNGEIFDDSNWLIHDSSSDVITLKDNINILQSMDRFITNKIYETHVNYFVSYEVSTINKLKSIVFKDNILLNTILKPSMEGIIKIDYDRENACVYLSLLTDNPQVGSYCIVRSDSKNDYKIWTPLRSFYIDNNNLLTNYYLCKDCTVEQGVSYKYGYQQYNAHGIYSDIVGITEIKDIDFDHMYLSDKDRQIKIAYNPKVSSFKKMILEQRTDTIGGKYPFYFKNGNAEYKEFPIAGLISYLLDEDEFFMLRTELGFQDFSEQRNLTNNNNLLNLKVPTTNLIGYNYTAERKFKLELLDWLSNGEEKLFRSPQEGNYVVRLTGVSLTPNDLLSRMIHEFSATAYECDSSNISDIVAAGRLVDTSVQDERIFLAGSISITNDLIIQLSESARFETINIDGAFPTTQFSLEGKEDNVTYTIGQTGSLAIHDLPVTNSLKILSTPVPIGVINYTYSIPIGQSENPFDNIVSILTNTTIGYTENLLNNANIINNIYAVTITPLENNGLSKIKVDNNDWLIIYNPITLYNIKKLEIENVDIVMYYLYCSIYIMGADGNVIQDINHNYLLAGEIIT